MPIERIGVPSYYWGTNAIHGMQNVNCLPSSLGGKLDFVARTLFPWVASRASMLYLAARTHKCAAVRLHAAHIEALREFWPNWPPTTTLPDEMPPRGGLLLPETLVLDDVRFRRRCHYSRRWHAVLEFLLV